MCKKILFTPLNSTKLLYKMLDRVYSLSNNPNKLVYNYTGLKIIILNALNTNYCSGHRADKKSKEMEQ